MYLFGVVTLVQSNLAFATFSEKIPLVEKFEQFPDQEITGFCNIEEDNDGNLHWRIKVYGLVPETKGHFDLNHWAGEIDVPYIANVNGEADSQRQTILDKDIPPKFLSDRAKCQVRIDGSSHFSSPVIAAGSLNDNSNNNSTNNYFFLFATLDYVFGIFQSDNNVFSGLDSFFGPPTPPKTFFANGESSNSKDDPKILTSMNKINSENSKKDDSPGSANIPDKPNNDKPNNDKPNNDKPNKKDDNSKKRDSQKNNNKFTAKVKQIT